MADVTSYNALFKEVVEPAVNTILDDTTIMLRWLERKKRKFDGEKFQVPITIEHNQGIAARSENGSLPAAGEETHKRAKFSPADNWGQMKFSQRLIEMARSDRGAFKDAIASESEGLIKSMKKDLNRQIFGDGSGKLSTLGTTTASTTVVTTDTKKLRVGMRVDILVIADGTAITNGLDRKITAITKDTSFAIADGGGNVTTSSSHGVYRAGNKVGSSEYEVDGLELLVKASGEFGELNPSTAGLERWAAHVFGSISGLTDEELQKGWDAPAENDLDASNDRLVIGTYGTRREYGRLLQTQRRFNDVKTKPASHSKLQGGGFDALEYNGTDFVVDRDVPSGVIYILDREALEWLVLAQGFKTDDGNMLKDDGGTGYKAPYYVMACLGTNNRGAHAKLTGVTEQ